MGIQGLLQSLKPYVEPVHVSKYSGQRVGIDAYSWLHKAAYGCTWQQLRKAGTQLDGDKLPQYVVYFMHRIKMLLYNNMIPVVVFDGGRLPLKALTEENRRRLRDENRQKAEQKLAAGDVLSAKEYFQRAVEITPAMANELVKVLREQRVEYVVAPYEADAQLAHLSRLEPEEGGVSTIITEDSDLLAYGCKVVLFKMDKFGNGEELCLARMLQCCPPPATGLSFRNFSEDMFLAMCVLAGCDFLASIPGIGVKTAHALMAKYRNVHRVLNSLKFSKHSDFPEGYINNFWQAKAIFKHARVYESKTGTLTLLNPLPDELLEEFGGDTDFLGPDLPDSRARAIAIGQLDPTTMRSFDLLPNRTSSTPSVSKSPGMDFIQAPKRESSKMPQIEPLTSFATGGSEGSFNVPPRRTTPFSTTNSPDMEFIQAQKREFFKNAQMEILQPSASSVLEESQVTSESGSESLHCVPLPITDLMVETSTSQSVTSSTPHIIDRKFLVDVKSTAFSGLHKQRAPLVTTTHSQVSGLDGHEGGLRQDIPNNNPFRCRPGAQVLVQPDISSSPDVNVESQEEDISGLSAENLDSCLIFSVQDSQRPSSPGEVPHQLLLPDSLMLGESCWGVTTTHSQVGGQDGHEGGLRQDIPNNNPFRSQPAAQILVQPDISSSAAFNLESQEEDISGLTAENPEACLIPFVQDSQRPSSSGEVPNQLLLQDALMFGGSCWEVTTTHSKLSGQDGHEGGLRQDIPNNKPFRSQLAAQVLVQPDISSSPDVNVEFQEEDISGLSPGNPDSCLISSVQDSQLPSSSGEALTGELPSLHCSIGSPMSPEPELAACCTTMDQGQQMNSVARVKSLDCGNWEASQRSSTSCGVSVLTDISPNVLVLTPSRDYATARTPSSAPLLRTKDHPFGSGKMGSAKTITRPKKPKSASQGDKRTLGGKRSRASLGGSEGSILRFFKPVPTPKKLTLK